MEFDKTSLKGRPFNNNFIPEHKIRHFEKESKEKGSEFSFYKGMDAGGKHHPGMIELGYDAKAAADSYLQYCKDRGYIPKFDRFAGEDNYYKLLIDFKAYDSNGEIAPQQVVSISGEGSFPGDFSQILEDALAEYEEDQSIQDELVSPIADELEEMLKGKNEDDVQYAISPTLRNDLQDLYDAKDFKGDIIIGNTSEFLVNDLKMPKELHEFLVTMNKEKAYKNLVSKDKAIQDRGASAVNEKDNYHNLGVDKMEAALRDSEKPMIAFVDLDNNKLPSKNRIVLVTSQEHKKSPVIVVMEFMTGGQLNGKTEIINKDITVFNRRSTINDIVNALSDGRILFVDKKNQQIDSFGRGQFPSDFSTADYSNNIANFWNNFKSSTGQTVKYDSNVKFQEKNDVQFRITWQDMEAYNEAYENYDDEAAIEILDKAVRSYGYSTKAFHQTLTAITTMSIRRHSLDDLIMLTSM